MTYALKYAARLAGGSRKKIYREGLSLCHAQFNGLHHGGIMEEDNREWFYFSAIA